LDDEYDDGTEPDVKSEPDFFISITKEPDLEPDFPNSDTDSFRCGVSTRARYLEDCGTGHTTTEPCRSTTKEKKPRKKGRKSKKSKSRGRTKGTEYTLNRKSNGVIKKSRRESKGSLSTALAQNRYTPDSLPLEIRNALREKIKGAVQELAKSVSGPYGEKAVRLQAQGYRVAGRILVRPNAGDGKNKFTVCGKLAEAAGMTEVSLILYLGRRKNPGNHFRGKWIKSVTLN